MTNDEIIQYYLNSGLINRCVDFQFAKLCKTGSTNEWKKQYKDDCFQDLIVSLYAYDNEKLNNIHQNKHFNAFITRWLINNVYSRTSEFYRKYLKLPMKTDFEISDYYILEEDMNGEEEE